MIRGPSILAAILAGLSAAPAQLDVASNTRQRAPTLSAGPAQLDDGLDARLRSQTQAMLNALATGDRRPWTAYLDPRGAFTDENGGRFSKDEMVAQVVALPRGVSGHIDITDWRMTQLGDVAIDTHIDDEHEDFHGQRLHALYRVTDTWVRESAGWRLIASRRTRAPRCR